MTKSIVFKWACTASLIAVGLLLGCAKKLPGNPVNLEPDDPRPIVSVAVADADEAALLVQKFGLEVVRMGGSSVNFFADAGVLGQLRDFGYQVNPRNSYDVFRRVVRMDRSVPEAELLADGVRIINREKRYLIVAASIGKLKALARRGVQITAISDQEPRPRQIRIVVERTADVAKIGAMQIDIYSAKTQATKPSEIEQTGRKANIVVYGGAFDDQIDQLRNAGYEVEILPPPASITGGGQS